MSSDRTRHASPKGGPQRRRTTWWTAIAIGNPRDQVLYLLWEPPQGSTVDVRTQQLEAIWKELEFAGQQWAHRPGSLSLAALLVMLTLCFVTTSGFAAEDEILTGQPAPDFLLQDQNGMNRGLADYRGRWLVLYFYPKDDTPGCTTEACQFRDDYVGVKQLGAEILGVSIDNRDSHAEFAKKYNLPFSLLADVDGRVARQYGALSGFWPLRFARRHTFLIDPQGKVAKIYRDVSPKTHSREVIADVQSLQQAAAR